MYKHVAFIPARSGSKRVPDKNIKRLCGHPLISYSIAAAISSGVFSAVVCATDSEEYASIARYYGAEVLCLRPPDISNDSSPDIEWVQWQLDVLEEGGRTYDTFSILRPTSPFRLPETIQRAYAAFLNSGTADSLRAVTPCKEHPGKMWVIRESRMLPLIPFTNGTTPWHSSPYGSLPKVYIQDASLEIAWVATPRTKNSIAGETIVPFISEGIQGFDINVPEDWLLAEMYAASGDGVLPAINTAPYAYNGDFSV